MSFFDLPAPRPPTEYRMPVWSRGPVDMVPGVVPVTLLVARTDTHAVLVTHLRAYPTGLAFTLTGQPRPGWPRTFETEQPDPPFLYYHGVGGSERWQSNHWLWGLPPPGPLAFVWPAGQNSAAGAEIDARLVLEAADRATTVWPTN